MISVLREGVQRLPSHSTAHRLHRFTSFDAANGCGLFVEMARSMLIPWITAGGAGTSPGLAGT